MNKIIIFDFDGVLADSVQTVFKMNSDVVSRIGKTITTEQYLACFEGHINQGMAKLLNLNEEEKAALVEIKAGLFPKYYVPENVKLFDFSKELVIEASKLGELWIVSSSPSELIRNVLDEYGLTTYFAKINGQNKQAKSIIFENALSEMKNNNVFFITDTTGDLKETKQLNQHFLTIAVPWGFHTAELLQTENPSILVQNSNQIIDFIKLN